LVVFISTLLFCK